MAQVEELKQLLEKKATFQRGCRCLASEFNAATYQQLLPLVSRAHTLLKTRHTNPEFWRSGLQLFRTCAQVALPPGPAEQIAGYVATAQEHLDAQEAQDSNERSAEDVAMSRDPDDILDSILSGNPLIAGALSTQPRTHYDDAGPIVDDHDRWQRAQGSGAAPAAAAASAATAPDTADATTNQQQGSDTAGTPQAAAQQPRRNMPAISPEMQRQILEGVQAVFDGMAAVTRGTEAIERELESVLAAFSERRASQGRTVPPMSKRLLDSLPVIELDSERLASMDADTRCPICTDALQTGDKVFSLPCRGKHWFHPACVRPWLQKTNSCPVCRDELPTDDPHYESAKERAKEEQEERQGAANALSHNEFMYV